MDGCPSAPPVGEATTAAEEVPDLGDLSGRVAARRLGVGPRGQLRAGTALVARGEFSVVIASLGAGTSHGDDLGALAAGYVLLTAIAGPLAAKYADRDRPQVVESTESV